MKVGTGRLRKRLDKYGVTYTLVRGWDSPAIDPYGGKAIDYAYQDLIKEGQHDRAPDYYMVLKHLAPPPRHRRCRR